MIESIRVKSGYALKLDRLKQEVVFQKGLNILFGPNGCGKSTVLKIVAAYCGINTARKECGWSKLHSPGDIFGLGAKKKNRVLPEGFKKFSPGGCEAEVKWDGTPTLLLDPGVTDNTTFTHFYDSTKDSPDGMTDMMGQVQMMQAKVSSGEMRLMKLKKAIDAMKSPPVITEMPKKAREYNDVWQRSYESQTDYYKSLPRTGPATVMLDEPERSLGIHNQMLFWKNLVPQMSRNFQVIVATHSPFAFISKNAKWIEFEPGYYENSREALRALSE